MPRNHSFFQDIMTKVRKRNFDNDVVRIVNQADRYSLDGGPIRIGTQTILGSLVEAIIQTASEMDILADELYAKIDELETEVVNLKENQPKPENTPEQKNEKPAAKPRAKATPAAAEKAEEKAPEE